MNLYNRLRAKLKSWLTYEPPLRELPRSDFDRLKYEIRPGDVILVEGRSRISKVTRIITQSSWTHAALYIGRISDIENEELRKIVRDHTDKGENTRLIIEDLLDKGTVVNPLSIYRHHHVRICRPIGIVQKDVDQVIAFAIRYLGKPYNVRQLLDLARFMLPWSIMPRRWRSSLFRTSTGEPESVVCSTMIAEAFTSVQFPILPFMKIDKDKGLELFHRNPYLFTPKDFDFSPYFEIIKYPLFSPEDAVPYYRRLPWSDSDMVHQDQGIISSRSKKDKQKKEPNDKNGKHLLNK